MRLPVTAPCMKFQKYLRELELDGSSRLPSLNYKLLKSEVKELICEVEAGHVSDAKVRERFASRLGDELEAVGDPWASHVRLLSARASEFFRASETLLCGDFLHESFCDDLRPLMLLEPLKPWLELAAWADSLRRHRLLQAAAVVKIEKKLNKALSGCPLPRVGHTPGGDVDQCSPTSSRSSSPRSSSPREDAVGAAGLLRRSAFGGDALHALCRQLEAFGDAMLRLGFGVGKPEELDPCAICLGGIVDPARLPCGHRFCVNCVLPLFGESSGSADASGDTAMLKCPLCRAAGPAAPQALSLDGLLPRMERGMGKGRDEDGSDIKVCRFTAVVVSSLARLAACDVACKCARLPHRSASSTQPCRHFSSMCSPPCSPICKPQLPPPNLPPHEFEILELETEDSAMSWGATDETQVVRCRSTTLFCEAYSS